MEELIVKADGKGSVTSGGPSRCGTPEGFFRYYLEICRKIYHEDERILGRIVMGAKRSIIEKYYPDSDRYYGPAVIWTLFGDPALRVKYPPSATVKKAREITADKDGTRVRVYASYIIAPVNGAVTVYNVLGKRVFYKRSITKGTPIQLNRGVYYVHFHKGNNELVERLLILQ